MLKDGGSSPVSPVWGECTYILPVSPVWWELCECEGCYVAVPGLCEDPVSLVSSPFFIYTMHMSAQANGPKAEEDLQQMRHLNWLATNL